MMAGDMGSDHVQMLFEDQAEYYSFMGTIGDRDYMEDAANIYRGDKSFAGPTIFAVFDGHGGRIAAEFCAEKMGEAIANHPYLKSNPKKAVKEAFLLMHENYARVAKKTKHQDMSDGTTATVLYVYLDDANSPKRKERIRYILACAGDSRAVLVKRDANTIQLCKDHNCKNEAELIRVRNAGGEILVDEDESPRVYSEDVGGLAVTRSIGDVAFKPYVTAEPELTEGYLTKDDAYILLASDGLWETISNDDVGKVLVHRKDKLSERVRYLVVKAKQRDNARTQHEFLGGPSCDNITALCVDVRPMMVTLMKHQHKLERMAKEELARAEKLKGDTIVLGIPREGYLADIILWRMPIRSAIWLTIGCLVFYLVRFAGYSGISIAAYLLLVQLSVTTSIVKFAPIMKQAYLVDENFETELFLNEGLFFTPETLEGMSLVAYSVFASEFNNWQKLVTAGSAKSLLIALRNVSYFLTPVATEDLLFATYFCMMSVVGLYDRNQIYLNKRWRSFVSNATLFQRNVGRGFVSS